MGFLIAEILGLLALAAIAGGAFVYWWTGRKFVDVSSEYESQRRRLQGIDDLRQAKAKADSRVIALEAEILQIERRLTDELEWRRTVQPKLDTLEPVQIAPVLAKLDELGGAVGRIKPTDVSGVEAKLGSLSGAIDKIRPPDLKPIEGKLGLLEGTVAELHNTDVSGIETKVAAVGAAIAALKSPDLDPVEQRLSAIEARLGGLRATDVSGVEKEVGSLRAAVGAIKPTDLSAVEARLTDVSRGVAKLQNADLSPVEARMDSLAKAVDRLEARIKPAPAPDFSGLLTRLGGIERSLAATPHPVALEASPQPQASSRTPAPTRERAPGGNLLQAASHGKPDDLKRIKGVGPKLEGMLHDIGVYYFWQVSDWRKADVQLVDDKLQVFKGRIERDGWVDQAKSLAREAGVSSRPLPRE